MGNNMGHMTDLVFEMGDKNSDDILVQRELDGFQEDSKKVSREIKSKLGKQMPFKPEEAVQMFTMMDANKDGKVTREEAKALFAMMGQMMEEGKIKDPVQQLREL